MSGFTRSAYWYGDALVYEALHTKWARYHARHCLRSCNGDWLTHALERFDMLRWDGGFVALVGPGLTVNVDLGSLTTDSLWEAVTGTLGEGWTEQQREDGAERADGRRATWKQCGLHRAAEQGYRVQPMHATTVVPLGDHRPTPPRKSAPKVVPFGKYKGRPLAELLADREYCAWLVEQVWFRNKYGPMHALIVNADE